MDSLKAQEAVQGTFEIKDSCVVRLDGDSALRVDDLLALIKELRVQNQLRRYLSKCIPRAQKRNKHNDDDLPRGLWKPRRAINLAYPPCSVDDALSTACDATAWDATLEHLHAYQCEVDVYLDMYQARTAITWIVYIGTNIGRIWFVRALAIGWWKHMNYAVLNFIGSCTARGDPVHLKLLHRDVRLLMRSVACLCVYYSALAITATVLWISTVYTYYAAT